MSHQGLSLLVVVWVNAKTNSSNFRKRPLSQAEQTLGKMPSLGISGKQDTLKFLLLYVLGPESPQGSLDAGVCFLFLGELEHAQSTLQRCLELDPTSVDAHLLMSQIYLAQGNFAMCSHSLELGVSHNFQVGVPDALSLLSTPQSPSFSPCSPWESSPRSCQSPSAPSPGPEAGTSSVGSWGFLPSGSWGLTLC